MTHMLVRRAEKVTITVDRAKLTEARVFLAASSASAAIDRALSEVIRRGRLGRDVEAYRRAPPSVEEVAIGQATPDWLDLADDTDWEAEWPDR